MTEIVHNVGTFFSDIILIIDQLMTLASQHPDVIIGLIMPPIIEYLNKDVIKRQEKVYVTIISCILVSAIINWQNLIGGDVTQVLESASIVLAGSQVVYQLYFKDSYYQKKIRESVEKGEVVIPERLLQKDKYKQMLDN